MPDAQQLASFSAMNQDAASLDRTPSSNVGDSVLPCQRKRHRLRLAVRDPQLTACQGLRYELRAGGETFSGIIGESRIIDHLIRRDAESGTLLVWLADHGDPMAFPLEFHLMPAGIPRGVTERLANLGFDCDDETDLSAEKAQEAIAGFEETMGAQPNTGRDQVDPVYSTNLDGFPEEDGVWEDELYGPLPPKRFTKPGKMPK